MQMLVESQPGPAAIMEALSAAILLIDGGGMICQANASAEQILATSRHGLIGHPLEKIIPEDSPIHALVRQVRSSSASIADHGIPLETQRVSVPAISIYLSPVLDANGLDHGWVAMVISPHTIAQRIDQQLLHRHAGRSIVAMSALLAHEVKNPLASIRGAAQLMEASVATEDRELVVLICDEVDRINSLVDRMGLAADPRGLSMRCWSARAASPRPASARACSWWSATTPHCRRPSAITTN